MGSGTTGIEALCCGRKFLGIDINPLATFLATVKMTPLTKSDLDAINSWAITIPNIINLNDKIDIAPQWSTHVKYLPWWLRKTVASLLEKAQEQFKLKRQVDFIRCAILSTGQWALDCKKNMPHSKAFIKVFQNKVFGMIEELNKFQGQIRQSIDVPLSQVHRRRKVLARPIAGIERDKRVVRHWTPAKLVLTSPPYPGVHVVYNRWQIHGRKETPAPYWIINSPDGNGLSYYTLGDRKQKELKRYFENLKKSFISIKHLMGKNSVLVQLIGFSDPSWQLKKYLEIMSEIGFSELKFSGSSHGLYSRLVPNRKWYTQYKKSSSSSDKEFLLMHKL